MGCNGGFELLPSLSLSPYFVFLLFVNRFFFKLLYSTHIDSSTHQSKSLRRKLELERKKELDSQVRNLIPPHDIVINQSSEK